jgi:hypothetical protein
MLLPMGKGFQLVGEDDVDDEDDEDDEKAEVGGVERLDEWHFAQ